MAQSSQALRVRIKSVNSTRKITKAMEMIANAKLFKQRSKMEANREYAAKLQETIDEIVEKNPDVESRFTMKRTNEKTMTIIFCSDLGLCGGYNANVLKFAREHLIPEDPVLLIGTSLMRQLKEEGFNVINEEPLSSDRMHFLDIKDCVKIGIQKYEDNEIGKLQLLYTRFVNTMTFRPDLDQLLPCVLTPDELEHVREREEAEKDGVYVETLFEPDPGTILNNLIPMMIENVAYSDWMESTTAEQGSRRVAMKTATDNADELSQSLLLEYNKIRQANITQEITEIVGGSAAV
ncbi:MAG: ATP synthase F1 subunit gamma [Solobacterium sp.]|nr:ATP synthase F1 subunit gamma [Solobacterium sp.]